MAGTGPGVHRPPHRLARRPPGARPRDAAARGVARPDRDLRGRLRGDGGRRARAPWPPGRSCGDRSSTWRTRGSRRRSRASSSSRCTEAPTTTDARTATRRSCRPRSPAPTTRSRPATSTSAFFAGVREALAASSLGPWTSQVEWGLGQWEINLEYQRALEMADRHILFKLAMRDLASAAGMVVDVHAQALRRHHRLVVPPPPVARERERHQRLPRWRRRERRVGEPAPGGGRRACSAHPS